MTSNFDFVAFDDVTSEGEDFGFVSFDAQPQKKKDESFLKWAARTAYQVPSGIAQAFTYPADIASLISTGAAMEAGEFEDITPQEREENIRTAMDYAQYHPTQSNIERMVEEQTGLPLTPQTGLQKAVKLGSTAAIFAPSGVLPKATAGVTAPAVSHGLQEVGVPEFASELVGLGVSGLAGAGSQLLGKSTKPSGLTTRRFESLKSPREVSEARFETINAKVEQDFKNLTNKIIEEAPIKKTHSALAEDSAFKKTIEQGFDDLKELAPNVPGTVSSKDFAKEIANMIGKRKGTGMMPSESDQSYLKHMKKYLKDSPAKENSFNDLVTQYRKNNRAFGESYEPGQSKAFNRGKREALTDYNKAIAKVIEEKYAGNEASKTFKELNKQWTDIKDAEAINTFINEMFEGQIKYDKGRKFFDNERMTQSFKRALGEKGYKDFEQLLDDLMTTEKGMSMLKVARKKGFEELAKDASSYIMNPTFLKGQLAVRLAKKAYNALLDKPRLALQWKKGVDAFKKADFKTAEKEFEVLKGEIEEVEKAKSVMKEPEAKTEIRELEGKSVPKLIDQKIEVKPNTKAKIEKKFDEINPLEDAKRRLNEAKEHLKRNPESALTKAKVERLKNEIKSLKPQKEIAKKPKKTKAQALEEALKVEKRPDTKAKIEKKLDEIKRQDISKQGLKTQKEYLLDKIEKALDNPPEGDKINIKVPGDGEFNIKNDPKALKEVQRRVKRDWPDKPLSDERARLMMNQPRQKDLGAPRGYLQEYNQKKGSYWNS